MNETQSKLHYYFFTWLISKNCTVLFVGEFEVSLLIFFFTFFFIFFFVYFVEYGADEPFPFDIVFALNAYGNNAQFLFSQQKALVNQFLDSFRHPLGNDFLRIGLVSFGRNAYIVKNLNERYTIPYIRKYLRDLEVPNNGAAIGQAVKAAADSIFLHTNSTKLKFLVLISDVVGLLDKNILREAKITLQNLGVEIIFVGNNKMKLGDLQRVASQPNNVIRIKTDLPVQDTYYMIMDKIIDGM